MAHHRKSRVTLPAQEQVPEVVPVAPVEAPPAPEDAPDVAEAGAVALPDLEAVREAVEAPVPVVVPNVAARPDLEPPPVVPVVPAAPKPRRCVVSVPGTHVGSHEVTVPADAANPTALAIDIVKQRLGIVSFGAGPVVEFLD
jgi:hypothetical protein